ncbi:MAG: Gfo/Idh/MocA family oxidoreductase [Gemmatimonadota bacterium]
MALRGEGRQHRIGLIGCGWFSHFHLDALLRLGDRVRVVWVADPDETKARSLASEAGARPLADYREGLGEVDAAFVLVPHHLHHPVTVACLDAGLHVLLEKPMALTTAEADGMIAAADRAGRALMVAYPHRYRPGMQVFREAVTGGRYGRLIMLDALMDETVKGYVTGWIARRETLGGGVFFSASPHMLDVMLWVAGEVRSLSLVGTRGGSGIEGEDTACAVIKFESGAIGVTRHTWASPRPQVWYTMRALCERAYVTLTTTPVGNFIAEGPRCRWQTRVTALGAEEEVLLESDEGLEVLPEIRHFLDCVETGRTPQTDGRAGRRMIALVREAYRDAEARGALD